MGCSFIAGIQSALGDIADVVVPIASVVPGPWQVPALAYNAVHQLEQGNVLGAIASGVGAYGAGGGFSSGGFNTNTLTDPFSNVLSTGAPTAAAGLGNTPAGYTLTGDLINDAATLNAMGYSGNQIDGLLSVGSAGQYISGLGTGATGGAATVGAATGGGGGSVTGNTTLDKLLSGGLNTAGGIVAGNAAVDAAKIQAAAQVSAAQLAADAAKFRPVGVTTGFGSSQFGYDGKGNLTSAGYTLTPEMQRQQQQLLGTSGGLLNQFAGAQAATAPMGDAARRAMQIGQGQMDAGQTLMSQATDQWLPNINDVRAQNAGLGIGAQRSMTLGNQYLANDPTYTQAASNAQYQKSIADTARYGTAATNMANLGDQYLSTSPQEQANKYMQEQIALLATGRERDLSGLLSKMQAQGRTGMATGATTTGMGAANPQLEAFYNAQRQQDLGLAAQATQGGMDYAKFGTGMLSSSADMQKQQYANQTAMMDPFNQQQQNEMNLAKYGTSMVGAGGALMSQMYGNQAAAYDPYKTALGIGQQQTSYGTGMVGTGGDMLSSMYGVQNAAFAPYQTALGGAQTIEGLGQNALTMGMDLGGKVTAANASAGNLLGTGMTNAAATMAPANAYSPWGALLSGAGNTLSGYRFDPMTGKAI